MRGIFWWDGETRVATLSQAPRPSGGAARAVSRAFGPLPAGLGGVSDVKDAINYRNRAEEIRVIAEDFQDENRQWLLNVAETYEAMAETAERQARSEKVRA